MAYPGIKQIRLIPYFLILLIIPFRGIKAQPISPLFKSHQAYVQQKANSAYGLEWIGLGPAINSALVEALAVDHSRPGTMYAGFGSGNLWKTENNGLSWNPIFEEQPSYGIGCITLAPSNPDIIYLGTGETLKKPRNFTMPGTGVYRSDDAGKTWRHLGLPDSYHIGEIAVHPTNPQIVYVAVLGHFWTTNTNRGVYRSVDGGKNWEHVLYINERTGANAIEISSSEPNVIYASMWQDFPGVSGRSGGIYRSTDSGKTWEKSDTGLPEGEGKGRIGLAVSATNPDKVYALIDHRGKPETAGAAEVYRSLDGGKSWKRTHQEELMIFSVIGWYFTDIYLDPINDEEIYALGVRLAHSTNGGRSFNLIGGDVYHLFPSPADPLHLDQCILWINPTNPKHLVLGNDGGLYLSYDKGNSWLHLNNIPTGEFYDITIDRRTPYTIYGGTQDNATVYGHATERSPDLQDDWKYLWIDPWSGGDGCITVVDPVDSTTIYFSAQEGAVRRMNLSDKSVKPVGPEIPSLKDNLHFNFISPYFLSPHDHNTLYLGGNYMLRSNDRGDNWTVISKDLTEGKDIRRKSNAAGAFAESEIQKGLLYAGTDKGLFWVSRNGGETWTEYSEGLPAAYVRSIVPSRFKASRVYVALSGLNYDDFSTYLFVSEDFGKTWQPINGNLEGEISYVIREDPVHEQVLYAGLYRGVYISTNRGKSWSLLGKNMPAAAVADLEIEPGSADLIAATHGRGLFKMNLKPIYEGLGKDDLNISLFDVPAAKLPRQHETGGGIDRMTTEKLPITFWLKHPEKVRLDILDSAGKILHTTSLGGKHGYNQYKWDLIIQRNESPLPYFTNYERYLPRGVYRVRLSTAGESIERNFSAK